MKKRVAVIISGNGSNLQALIDAAQAEDYPAEIALVISNKAKAYGLERAKAANIKTCVISHKDYDSRDAFDAGLNAALRDNKIEIVCLAGFMRILTQGFVEKWAGKMLNIHPSLLPDYKGLNVQQRAIDAGEKESGCTVHVVTPELDDGPIIDQSRVPILPDDTSDTLSARIQIKEHTLYPSSLKKFIEDPTLSS